MVFGIPFGWPSRPLCVRECLECLCLAMCARKCVQCGSALHEHSAAQLAAQRRRDTKIEFLFPLFRLSTRRLAALRSSSSRFSTREPPTSARRRSSAFLRLLLTLLLRLSCSSSSSSSSRPLLLPRRILLLFPVPRSVLVRLTRLRLLGAPR